MTKSVPPPLDHGLPDVLGLDHSKQSDVYVNVSVTGLEYLKNLNSTFTLELFPELLDMPNSFPH